MSVGPISGNMVLQPMAEKQAKENDNALDTQRFSAMSSNAIGGSKRPSVQRDLTQRKSPSSPGQMKLSSNMHVYN